LNNPKWQADAAKAKSKALFAVKVAKANHKALENELKKLGTTAAGRRRLRTSSCASLRRRSD
jgi:hypothetical protein